MWITYVVSCFTEPRQTISSARCMIIARRVACFMIARKKTKYLRFWEHFILYSANLLEYSNTKLNSLRRNYKSERRDNHRLAFLSTSVLSLINNLSKRKEVFSKILLNCSKVSPGGISEITAFQVNDNLVLIFPQLIANLRTNRQHLLH